MIVNAFSASVPQTTKTATEFWLGVFTSFGLKPVTPKELEQALCGFYIQLRKKDGEMYRRACVSSVWQPGLL